jgi:hypothetical protein
MKDIGRRYERTFPPFAGMTRIRFSGSPLQQRGLSVPVAGHPGEQREQTRDGERRAQAPMAKALKFLAAKLQADRLCDVVASLDVV